MSRYAFVWLITVILGQDGKDISTEIFWIWDFSTIVYSASYVEHTFLFSLNQSDMFYLVT